MHFLHKYDTDVLARFSCDILRVIKIDEMILKPKENHETIGTNVHQSSGFCVRDPGAIRCSDAFSLRGSAL